MKGNNFIIELKEELPKSSNSQREQWAKYIIQESIKLSLLNPLLFEEKSIAIKYSWLLSNIAIESPRYLYKHLSELLITADKVSSFDFKLSMVNYWAIAGIPTIDEGKAMSMLFNYTQSSSINSTMKARAFKCLLCLYKKHPQIREELVQCLESQKNKYSNSFNAKIEKMLLQLN